MINFFQALWDLYNTNLMTGVDHAITSALTSMAQILELLGVMFVCVFGLVTLTGDMSARQGLSLICRLVLVQVAMVPAYFNEYVRDVVLVWFPNWLSEMLGTGMTAKGIDGSAAQFDDLLRQVVAIEESLHLLAGSWDFAKNIEISVLGAVCQVIIVLTFLVWALTRILLALTVSVAPFIFVLYLFRATRGFVERWVGQLGSSAILLIMITILLQVTMAQYTGFLNIVKVNTAGNLAQAIQGLTLIMLNFLMNIGILFFIPKKAMAIGSGITFSPGDVSRAFSTSVARVLGSIKKRN